MIVDVTNFRNAVARLEEGQARYLQNIGDLQIRDGLIQRFEFTYEIAHKTLRRFLAATAASPEEYQTMAFSDLIRSANRRRLLQSDWPIWRHYRDMRSKTSHTDDEPFAREVVQTIPNFIQDAAFLLNALTHQPE